MGRKEMPKTYMVWWHSVFVDEINRDQPTIAAIVQQTHKMLQYLEELQHLEEQGKITMTLKGSLNPLYLHVKDPSVEQTLAKNPLVETLEK